MATIKSVLKLEDEMTETINKVLNRIKALEEKMEEVNKKVNAFPMSFQALDVAVGSLMATGIQKLVQFGIQAVKTGLDFNTSMETYLTNFTTLLGGSVDAATEKVEELQEFAAKTPFSMSELAKGTQTLLAYGIQSEYTTDVLRTLGDVALGNGQAFETLTTVFGRISAQGKTTMEDINQMIGVGFNPLNIIAEKTGLTMVELQKQVSNGAVSAQMIAEAFKTATSEGGQFFQGMESASQTMAGITSTLKDNVASAFGTLMKPLSEGMKTLTQVGITIVGFLQPILESFSSLVIERGEAIKLVLIALGVYVTTLAIKWTVSWVIMNLQTIAVVLGVISVIWLIIEVLNFFGIDTNTVIGGVIGAFYSFGAIANNIFYEIVNIFGPFVSGMLNGFATLGNFVANVFHDPAKAVINLFVNMGQGILNILGKITERIDGVFGTKFSTKVQGWSDNLENTRTNLIQKFTKNEEIKPFKDDFDISVKSLGLEWKNVGESWNKGFEKGTNLLGNLGEKMKGVGKALNVGGTNSNAKSITDLINSMDKTEGSPLTNVSGSSGKGLGKINDSMSGVSKSLGSINKGTAELNKKLSGEGSLSSVGETKIKDENLKYLLDISEMKYQQNYQNKSSEIVINVSTGDINNGADEQRLVKVFENSLMNALENNLKGAY